MIKKVLATVLACVLTFGACWTWTMAKSWGDALGIDYRWFDVACIMMLAGAVFCSCVFNMDNDETER